MPGTVLNAQEKKRKGIQPWPSRGLKTGRGTPLRRGIPLLTGLVLLCVRHTVFIKNCRFRTTLQEHVYGAMFPTASAHFVSLCHISVILAVFQTFHYCYIHNGDLQSVSFEVTNVILGGTMNGALIRQ